MRIDDFTWIEVGLRIRDRRVGAGLSQQALGAAAGITQNAVYRLELGETNPQLSTLSAIAGALRCSVRDLVIGTTDGDSRLAERVRRIKRVVDSGDTAALMIVESALTAAEAMLDRRSEKRTRKVRMLGEPAVRTAANSVCEVFVSAPRCTAKLDQKANRALRHSKMNDDAGAEYEQL